MKHILFDLKDCPFNLLDDARFVRNSLFHASILSESQILKIDFHKFQPQGVSWDEVQEYWWNNCRSLWFEGTVIHVIDKPKKKSKGFA